jgi:predicted GTPase
VTGCGKSTVCNYFWPNSRGTISLTLVAKFVNTVSGDSLQTSDRLGSCTAEVQLSKPFMVNGRTVRLVDTPGFNDSTRSDTEVLGVVGDWMKTS